MSVSCSVRRIFNYEALGLWFTWYFPATEYSLGVRINKIIGCNNKSQ